MDRLPRGPLPCLAAAYALALLAGILSLWVSGAWAAGFSGADEPAHFLNSWFVAAYAKDALGQDPLAFATEYYLHYPKISIGHWPPAFYGLAAPVFFVAPPTPATAFALNLFVSALPALGVAALLLRMAGHRAAIGGALLWALTPLALEGQAFFMLDQALAACAVAALLAWLHFAERQTWPRILLFAGLAALGILIKGNGWLIVLAPAFHIALTGQWALLRSTKLWAGAALGLALVGPWYWATAGISADGFNHEWGLAYAAEALAFNLGALAGNVGPAGLVLAAFGAGAAWIHRGNEPGPWHAASGALALILAALALQSAVPVDLDPRYMAPALPALVALAVHGALAAARAAVGGRPGLAAGCAALLLLPGAIHLDEREPKADLRMEEAAALASADARSEAWLVDGGSGAEGAFIAAMAVRDPELRRYSVRASKLLAESDFMGNSYRLRTSDPAAAAGELRRLGVGDVVLARRSGVEDFAHGALLEAALRDPASGFRLEARLPHRGRSGMTEIWRAEASRTANAEAIRAMGLPGKAKLAMAP